MLFTPSDPLGGLLLLPHVARHWVRSETQDGDNIVTGTTLTDGGVIKCHLVRNLSAVALDETGLTSTTGGKVLMPLQYHDQVKTGDEMQIDSDRFQVINQPVRVTGLSALDHCWVYVRKADAV